MAKKNGKSTFIVQILSQQNTTWQGLITWTEGRQTQYYRSALEFMKLIDSAVAEEIRESGREDDRPNDDSSDR